jgi:putative redox protein
MMARQASRYTGDKIMADVTVISGVNLRNEVRYGEGQSFNTDEPVSIGGDGTGADPYTLLLAALGSCISMTLTLYARRKNWPLEGVTVRLSQRRVHAADCAECENSADGFVQRIERSVQLEGAQLTAEQHARLLDIAHKCPIHKTLTSEIVIVDAVE